MTRLVRLIQATVAEVRGGEDAERLRIERIDPYRALIPVQRRSWRWPGRGDLPL